MYIVLLFLLLLSWGGTVYLVSAALLERRHHWLVVVASLISASVLSVGLLVGQRLVSLDREADHNAVIDVASASGTSELRLTNLGNDAGLRRWRWLLNDTGDIEVQTGRDSPPWAGGGAVNRLNLNADASLVILRRGGLTVGTEQGEPARYSFEVLDDRRDVVAERARIESAMTSPGKDGVAGTRDDLYDLSFWTRDQTGRLASRGGVDARGVWRFGDIRTDLPYASEHDAVFDSDLFTLRPIASFGGLPRGSSESLPGRDVVVHGGAAGAVGANRGGRVRLTTGAPGGTGPKPLIEIDASGDVPTPETLEDGHIGFRFARGRLTAYINDNGTIRAVELNGPDG